MLRAGHQQVGGQEAADRAAQLEFVEVAGKSDLAVLEFMAFDWKSMKPDEGQPHIP